MLKWDLIVNDCFLSIGTNKGSKISNIKDLIKKLEFESFDIADRSSIYETEALLKTDQPKYYNMVLKINSKYDCNKLFIKLKNIEHDMGRDFYSDRYSPRIIDIDILTFNNKIISNEMIQVPHGSLHLRRFVLEPWHEISPEFNVPNHNLNVSELLNISKDISIIRKLDYNI